MKTKINELPKDKEGATAILDICCSQLAQTGEVILSTEKYVCFVIAGVESEWNISVFKKEDILPIFDDADRGVSSGVIRDSAEEVLSLIEDAFEEVDGAICDSEDPGDALSLAVDTLPDRTDGQMSAAESLTGRNIPTMNNTAGEDMPPVTGQKL